MMAANNLNLATYENSASTSNNKQVVTQECNWIDTLSEEEVRTANMHEPDINIKKKQYKEEYYALTDIDLSLSSRTVKYFWNSSTKLLMHRGIIYYEWPEKPDSKRLLVVPTSMQKKGHTKRTFYKIWFL